MQANTIRVLRAILIANGPSGTPMSHLCHLYMEETHECIPCFGYISAFRFLQSSGEFEITNASGWGISLKAKVNDLSAHVVAMIALQPDNQMPPPAA